MPQPTPPLRDVVVPTVARKVLVVEDDGLVANLMVEALARAGHRLELRSNAVEALRAVLHGEFEPDVVIADVDLADASGIELARMIESAVPGAAIVLVSSHDPDGLPLREMLGRGYRFLPKPFGVRRLQEELLALG